MNRTFWTGIAGLTGGLLALVTGKTRHNMPVSDWAAKAVICLSAAVVLVGVAVALLDKIRGKSDGDTLICPRCETMFFRWEVPGSKCLHDKTSLELAKGYYNRHPERKDKPVRENLE